MDRRSFQKDVNRKLIEIMENTRIGSDEFVSEVNRGHQDRCLLDSLAGCGSGAGSDQSRGWGRLGCEGVGNSLEFLSVGGLLGDDSRHLKRG
ncbi:hypothetical protein BC830DRAFT_1138035 [Chytriomyces sp. MP71]|nr:hypothetical protein BC830DRAFT_1140203 [Chytriomyces sp. MP71]KAI8612163.1 hypothetical protein BC830DRAFT_1138035 [Chytriomyces sp. MP71]